MTHTNPVERRWFYSRSRTEVDVHNVAHLAELHIGGMSYSEMERTLGVPHSTAHTRVTKYLKHQGQRRTHNTFNLAQAITSDYLNENAARGVRLSRRQRAEVQQWLSANHQRLASIEGTFYSLNQEGNISRRETSGAGDWSEDIIDNEENLA